MGPSVSRDHVNALVVPGALKETDEKRFKRIKLLLSGDDQTVGLRGPPHPGRKAADGGAWKKQVHFCVPFLENAQEGHLKAIRRPTFWNS